MKKEIISGWEVIGSLAFGFPGAFAGSYCSHSLKLYFILSYVFPCVCLFRSTRISHVYLSVLRALYYPA